MALDTNEIPIDPDTTGFSERNKSLSGAFSIAGLGGSFVNAFTIALSRVLEGSTEKNGEKLEDAIVIDIVLKSIEERLARLEEKIAAIQARQDAVRTEMDAFYNDLHGRGVSFEDLHKFHELHMRTVQGESLSRADQEFYDNFRSKHDFSSIAGRISDIETLRTQGLADIAAARSELAEMGDFDGREDFEKRLDDFEEQLKETVPPPALLRNIERSVAERQEASPAGAKEPFTGATEAEPPDRGAAKTKFTEQAGNHVARLNFDIRPQGEDPIKAPESKPEGAEPEVS